MQKKSKIKDEKGSMTVYAVVVLMTILVILTTLYSYTSSNRKSELKTVLKIKQAYEEAIDFIQDTTKIDTTPILLTNSKSSTLTNYKIYGNSVQQILPDDYVQVEYIEGKGKEYLVIDYIASGITKAKGKFQITNLSKAGFLFGSRGNAGKQFYGFNWGGGVPYKYYNSYSEAGISTTEIDEQIHTFYKDKGTLYIDNNVIKESGEKEFTTPGNMNVFACYSDEILGYLPSYVRIFNLQFYDNDELMVDLIPCYRKDDNVVGMYDVVNKKFYTNSGTGNFTAGTQAPTTNSPVEIQSVGEKTLNIWNEEWEQGHYSVSTGKKASYTSDTIQSKDFIPVLPSTTYYCYSATARLYLLYYDENYGYISYKAAQNGTITTPENCRYLTFYRTIGSGAQYDNDICINISDEEINGVYEPYEKYKIPVIVRGENLFDKNNYNVLYTAMGATALGTSAPNTYRTVYVKVEPNTTYTIQKQMDGIKNRFAVACFDEEPNYGSTVNQCLGGNDLNETTITTTSTTKYLAIYLWITGAELTPDETINSLIIEKGDKITLNKYNIYLDEPLRKVGDVSDYIDFKNKKVIRNFKYIELTENDDWSLNTSVSNHFQVPVGDNYFNGNENYYVMSNYYKQSNTNTYYCSEDYAVKSVDGNRIRFKNKDYSTLEEWKKWLEGLEEKLYVIYRLATSKEETIELPTISTKEGNYIIDINTNVKPTIEVTYKRLFGN